MESKAIHPFLTSSESDFKVHSNGVMSVKLNRKSSKKHGLQQSWNDFDFYEEDSQIGEDDFYQGVFKQTMNNYNDITYTGPVIVGGQQIEVVYDTGSDWLVIESASCSSCQQSPGQKFDQAQSSAFTQIDETLSQQNYGSAHLKGNNVQDTVCLGTELDSPVCLPEFEWFLITSQKGMPASSSGILGLSRGGTLGQMAPGPSKQDGSGAILTV